MISLDTSRAWVIVFNCHPHMRWIMEAHENVDFPFCDDTILDPN